ncbi:MAG TPA: sulfite exporter TauE/SafE family protein [Puia sp.]|nr:sulfite exporter TauE/SafE family protein [Puia sp.]
MKEIITYAASLFVGLSLGMIGAGGSILTVPVFVFVLKIDPLVSSVYSMFVVGISSLAGGVKAIFNKLVDIKTTIVFGIPSVTGVLIARKFIYPSIPDQIFSIGDYAVSKKILFMFCISSLMFTAAVRMLRSSPLNAAAVHGNTQVKTIFLLIQGFIVGIITGLFGIGGGFLIVPALYFWSRLPMKAAVGTALLIIAMNSLFSFSTSYADAPINWMLLLRFSLGAVIGILIGSRIGEKIPGNYLKIIFGWFVMAVSFYIVFKQFTFHTG